MEELKYSDVIYIKKGLLSPEECDILIQEREDREKNHLKESCLHARTDKVVQSTFTKVDLIPETESFKIVHKANESLLKEWFEYLEKMDCFSTQILKRMCKYSHQYRLMKYDVGGWIHPHIDWEHFTHASLTINLNDSYEGGDFTFFNGRHRVKLGKGDGLVFPADPFWVHEVKEITSGVRYSVNSFVCSLPLELKHQYSRMADAIGEDPNIISREHTYYPSNQERINKE
jgi:hypothetical protein